MTIVVIDPVYNYKKILKFSIDLTVVEKMNL